MIQRILSLSFLLFTLSVSGQKNENFKVGLALPIFTKSNKNITISSSPVLSVEKPFSFDLNSKNSIGINPGLAYFKFFENEQPQEFGSGISTELKHRSLNTFLKLFYNIHINKLTNSYIYLGPVAGLHIATSTKGLVEYYSDAKKIPSLSKNINESGRSFFESTYFGYIIGFHPKSQSKYTVTPSFELSYFPNFVSIYNNPEHALQISIFLGFSPKKKATQNE